MSLALGGVYTYAHDNIVDAKWQYFTMGANDFMILLPPSEGKATGGDSSVKWAVDAGIFGATLSTQRREIVEQLRKAKGGDQKLLGVGGPHLLRAQSVNTSLLNSPSLPAWQRYTGVVWDHLDLASMTAAKRKAFTHRIVIPSGLLGLVRADDPLPDYRLKMGARLTPFGLMSTWWRDALTEALVATVKKRVVIDLLPNEHRAAFAMTEIRGITRVDLVAHSGGVVGGHNAKAAKGLLAQHLLVTGDEDIKRAVKSFSHLEYSAKVSI
jgi:cytoplasmic iron level regulating protein YaaA (DUF328/UPF0246 family)